MLVEKEREVGSMLVEKEREVEEQKLRIVISTFVFI